MKKLLAGLVLATSLAACTERAPQVIAIPQTQATDVRPGAMTVTGSATLEVSPDCADLTMTLSTDGARPAVAATALSKKQQEVIDAMKKLGIEAADMKISHITLTPIYKDWQQLKLVTYRAEITITATTKQFDQIAAMMEAGANAGATTMTSQFRRSDLPELKKKVRAMALAAAKDKAKQTADTLGIGLGRVVSVAESQGGSMWRNAYFPQVANSMAVSDSSAVALGGALEPLTLDITIGFELARSI